MQELFDVGDVFERVDSTFEWRISNWNSRQQGITYHSPLFQVLDATWNVAVRPCPFNHIWFYVLRNEGVQNKQVVTVKLRARTGDGTEYKITKRTFEFTEEAYSFYSVFLEGKLLNNSFPFDDNLTVSCTVYGYCSITNTSAQSISSKCSETCIEGSGKEAEKNDGIIKDATLSKPTAEEDNTKKTDTLDTEDEVKRVKSGAKDLEKLSRNFKDLLLIGEDSDVTVKVNDIEFPVHKLILGARSSVFDKMFSHDMAEKKEGVVDIKDCTPDAFKEFLFYLYSGELKEFSRNTVFDLYQLSDKYDVQELKSASVEFMVEDLCIDNFCDVVRLALQHSESVLLEKATKFFAKNLKNILVSIKWQTFITENPIQANELYIKALNDVLPE